MPAGVVQGIPSRVCNVSQLLPRPALWGGAGLHVPAPAFQVPTLNSYNLWSLPQDPVPHSEPPVWLHIRLDNVEAESCRKCSWIIQPSSQHASATVVCCHWRQESNKAFNGNGVKPAEFHATYPHSCSRFHVHCIYSTHAGSMMLLLTTVDHTDISKV